MYMKPSTAAWLQHAVRLRCAAMRPASRGQSPPITAMAAPTCAMAGPPQSDQQLIAKVAVPELAHARHHRPALLVDAPVDLCGDDLDAREAPGHLDDAHGRRDEAQEEDLALIHALLDQHLEGGFRV